MKKKLLLSVFLFGFLLVFTTGNLMLAKKKAAVESETAAIYAHISYVDKGATVIRQDKTEEKAVVNLPIVPGDHIVTSENGRCEIQFDNGSIIRLDKNSRLKVTTIQAPMLTSKWTVSTLHLMRGQLYSMHQSYDRQLFQVITPNAAIDMKKRSATTIQIMANGDTFLFGDKGKVKVMYGKDVKSLKTGMVKKGKAYLVNAQHQLVITEDKRDIEFIGFNQYVNRHFEDLHQGISKVPKKIYRYSPGLVYWAEKWSSLYGDWVYDDIFGYVWKPADEIFAYSKRPFFHAGFTKINGKLYLVPQQKWGWAPAHLGTWVWMKWGWTWVPGNAFSPGFNNFSFPSLNFWMNYLYDGYDGYYCYRKYGLGYWATNYGKNRVPPKLLIAKLPLHIRKIIKKMNKTAVAKLQSKFGSNRPTTKLDKETLTALKTRFSPTRHSSTVVKVKPGDLVKSRTLKLRKGANISKGAVNPNLSSSHFRAKGKEAIRLRGLKMRNRTTRSFRDFNPDIKWGRSRGHVVNYSSRANAVTVPGMKLNSKYLSRSQRQHLRGKGSPRFSGNKGSYVSGSTGSTSTSSSSGNSRSGSSLKSGNKK